ncbi:MAG: hypothetical protein HQL82_03575 [Magnetococcales bacterium]|nr:hypothetical protein [Magnetococcales bacterium]
MEHHGILAEYRILFLGYIPEEVAYWLGTVNHIVTDIMQSGKILHEQA